MDLNGTSTYSPMRSVSLTTKANAGMHLFPNPTHGGAATLSGAVPGTEVRVFDALGRRVLAASGTTVLASAGVAAGVYVVRVGSKVLRLTVE